MKILICALLLLMAAPVWGQSFKITGNPEPSARTVLEAIKAELARIRLGTASTHLDIEHSIDAPPPPQLPENFSWKGRYIVRDLHQEVMFKWNGKDGNTQMIAGEKGDAVHFTNIIYNGNLYTLTYKWPLPIPNPGSCTLVGEFTRDMLNKGLKHMSRYVGAEILEEKEGDRHVHHFRAGVVLQIIPNNKLIPPVRFPLMLGDFYVDRDDPQHWWKLPHFGLQNLFDPQLDEWIVIDEIKKDDPGEVTLPKKCRHLKPRTNSSHRW
ncbi:MAG: hypothetical protein JSU59_11065 [Nitrospirota bacterium]|nr:MAG: hypothetical protein JSU59_11065 [Nitrospirota bacterium]